MISKCTISHCFSVFVMMALGFKVLYTQPIDVRTQENTVLTVEQHLDSLKAVRATLMDRADILANQIHLVKSKGLLSPSEHRRLEKTYRDSQVLSNQVNDIELQIREKNEDYIREVKVLTELYQNEIDRLIQLVDQDKLNADQGIVLQIKEFLKKKRERENELVSQNVSVPENLQIKAQSWDTLHQLRMKGDYLLDQEEVLRRQIDQFDFRIRSLEEEEKVRRKVQEFSHEMDLFDEREELLGRGAGVEESQLGYGESTGENVGPTFFGDYRDGQSKDFGIDGGESPLIKDLDQAVSQTHYSTLQTNQDRIDYLKKYRNRLKAHADSLNLRAEWFYGEAEKRRE